MASARTPYEPHICRRMHRRMTIEVPVVLISSHIGTTKISSARSFDLSAGGIRVQKMTNLLADQPVSIEFRLPMAKDLIKMNAVVRHAGEQFYGLEFHQTTQHQLEQIKMFCG